jgi:hypothetical protein
MKEQPMRAILLWAALIVMIVSAGCTSSASPKLLPRDCIRKTYGPTGKSRVAGRH